MRSNPVIAALQSWALVLGLGSSLLLLPDPAAAQEEKPDASAGPGLKVGAKAAAFTLKDQHGNEQSLAAYLKKGPVALVFHRSADW